MKSSALLGATLLAVAGHAERVETSAVPLVHLIAARLLDPIAPARDLTLTSRDLH